MTNIKQNPFSLYDFLGYFIPGAISIYSFFIVNEFFTSDTISLKGSIEIIKLDNTGYYLPFIICSYVLGHIISYLSSVSVEKYAIWRYDYPSKYLLRMNHDGFWGKQKRKIQITWRLLISTLILPIVACDLFIGKTLNVREIYTRQLDQFLIKIIIHKKLELIKKISGNKKQKVEEYADADFFRVILHYSYEHSKTHQIKLHNYVAIYGFLRSLAFISIIIHWIIVFHGILAKNLFCLESTVILILNAFVSYIFFMGFMKFYRRYTLEGFMTMISLQNVES